MADSNIGSLPAAESLNDDSLLVAEQQGQAVKVPGSMFKGFAREGVSQYVTAAQAAAGAALEAVGKVGTSVQDAENAAYRAEAAVVNSPKIQNGTWWVYNQSAGAYEDSGQKAIGPMGTITNIQRTSGTGTAGSLDTYQVTCSDGSTFTFTVQNGHNGEGAGDMLASIYDPQNKAQDIFAYVDATIGAAIEGSY